jgi:hypothetical protein
MIKTNPILAHNTLVKVRAAELQCTIQAVLGNVILCSRNCDDSYITWRCTVYNNSQVEFISGCYDMTLKQAEHNLIERALGYDVLGKSV